MDLKSLLVDGGLVAALVGAIASVLVLVAANLYTSRQFRLQLDEDRRARERACVAAIVAELQDSMPLLPTDREARGRLAKLSTALWLEVTPQVRGEWKSQADAHGDHGASALHPIQLWLKASTIESVLATGIPVTAVPKHREHPRKVDPTTRPLQLLGYGRRTEFEQSVNAICAKLLDWERLAAGSRAELFQTSLTESLQRAAASVWLAREFLGQPSHDTSNGFAGHVGELMGEVAREGRDLRLPEVDAERLRAAVYEHFDAATMPAPKLDTDGLLVPYAVIVGEPTYGVSTVEKLVPQRVDADGNLIPSSKITDHAEAIRQWSVSLSQRTHAPGTATALGG